MNAVSYLVLALLAYVEVLPLTGSAMPLATRGELDEPFREAAASLLARQPWGSDSGERS